MREGPITKKERVFYAVHLALNNNISKLAEIGVSLAAGAGSARELGGMVNPLIAYGAGFAILYGTLRGVASLAYHQSERLHIHTPRRTQQPPLDPFA